jgi:hypothetical protein
VAENKKSMTESASSSVEVTLMLMCNVGKAGVKMSSCKAEKGNTLAGLQDDTVWICGTGASNHVMWSSKWARNVQILRHTA